MSKRELYPDSYIFDCAILNEISERNKNIAVNRDENSYIAGTTALSCIKPEQRGRCRLIAQKIADYLEEHEPALFSKTYKATILVHEFSNRENDNRTLIFKKNDGSELGLLVKRYSHTTKHIRVMQPEKMLQMLFNIKNIPSEIIAEYNDNVIINIESESKEAVYDRYNSFMRRMISYACIQAQNSKAPEYLIRSLVGSNDYYCIDVIGSGNNIRISGFNMNGTLNLKPTPFPSRLIEIQRGNYSTGAFRSNMMTLIFDGGWMVTMRLHLASLPRNGECISPMQLKYDIALKNLPYGMEDERIPLS